MKRFSKTLLSLFLTLTMVMGFATTVFAAGSSIDFQGFSEGFDFRPGSEYTETDLFNNFKNVMPGDTVMEEITFSNSATDCDFVNLYMRAEAHDENGNPLSAAVAATGETVPTVADFLAQLSMKVWNGTDLIYEASPDELDGLAENKFLGTFRTGDSTTLRVELTVPLDLDNEYAMRVGEVDWVFHVEAYNESQLTVRKVWSDGNSKHDSDSVKVNLLKDGKVENTIELNAENQWTYTFDRLLEGHKWSVEEAEVPEGYTVVYDTVGNMTTITNKYEKEEPVEPAAPVNIGVRKVWDEEGTSHPDSVTVTLYNGNTPVETVRLGEWNQWSYNWKDLSAAGNWSVVEVNIPRGYTPSYTVNNGIVTIKNTATLIQTGQLNWPVAVLSGLGFVLISLGVIIIFRKKKYNNA